MLKFSLGGKGKIKKEKEAGELSLIPSGGRAFLAGKQQMAMRQTCTWCVQETAKASVTGADE